MSPMIEPLPCPWHPGRTPGGGPGCFFFSYRLKGTRIKILEFLINCVLRIGLTPLKKICPQFLPSPFFERSEGGGDLLKEKQIPQTPTNPGRFPTDFFSKNYQTQDSVVENWTCKRSPMGDNGRLPWVAMTGAGASEVKTHRLEGGAECFNMLQPFLGGEVQFILVTNCEVMRSIFNHLFSNRCRKTLLEVIFSLGKQFVCSVPSSSRN